MPFGEVAGAHGASAWRTCIQKTREFGFALDRKAWSNPLGTGGTTEPEDCGGRGVTGYNPGMLCRQESKSLEVDICKDGSVQGTWLKSSPGVAVAAQLPLVSHLCGRQNVQPKTDPRLVSPPQLLSVCR